MRLYMLMSVMTVLVIAGQSLAVDVRNEDDRKYSLRITQDGGTLNTSIGPNATLTNVASGEVKIQLKGGGGTVTASGNDVVVIRGGKLTKE